MARRPKKDAKFEEAAVGLVGLLIFLTIMSPSLRSMIFSTIITTLSFIFLIFILCLVVYLIIQSLKKDRKVATPSAVIPPIHHRPVPKVDPQPFKVTTPQEYTPHQTRIRETIQPLQPQKHEAHLQKFDRWDETILSIIEWKRFEVVTKEFMTMTGYDARETKIGADGGVDIRATKLGPGGFECLVQCKAWNTYTVGIKPIRELYGVMAAEKVARGMFVNSGNFTSAAEEFAKGKILLVSGARFLELIRKLPEDKQQKLLSIALEGDYRTPTCPQCDVKMIRKDVKKGTNVGGHMWGCPKFPSCRQTFNYKADCR
jgi:restriction system protein